MLKTSASLDGDNLAEFRSLDQAALRGLRQQPEVTRKSATSCNLLRRPATSHLEREVSKGA
jgi:hypothetical protein